MLVTIWGQYTMVNLTTFTVNDGSGPVTCVVPSGVSIQQDWNYVAVTGISSVTIDGALLNSTLRVRDAGDITVIE